MAKLDLDLSNLPKDGRLLISHPKCGRTWIIFALRQFGIDLTCSHAGAATNRREIGRRFGGIKPELEALPLIFLHRNPLDAAVSMYHQVHGRDLRRWSGRWWRMLLPLALRGELPPRDIDRFVLHPSYGVPKIHAYQQAWLRHLQGRADCLILSYEEMRADPATGFQKLADFCGYSAVSGAALAEASSFERMRQAEGAVASTGKGGKPSAAKVRRGKVRGYLDDLRPETIRKCERLIAAV